MSRACGSECGRSPESGAGVGRRRAGGKAAFVFAALAGWVVGSSGAQVLGAGPTAAAPADTGPFVIVRDAEGDASPRAFDVSGGALPDPTVHRLPDVVAWRIGLWRLALSNGDPEAGQWDRTGTVFRFDLICRGLVNPPGPIGPGQAPDPFRFGPNPIYGYIEFDMDEDADTGGELLFPQLRYLGSAARFGGLPAVFPLRDRTARGGTDFDGDLDTPPWVERSGEEFHIALDGLRPLVAIPSDAQDMFFGPGETWWVRGAVFHRAHAYEPFSYACCTGNLGSYEPPVTLRFSHDPVPDQTTITLFYPLTNAGSAALRNETHVESNDGDAGNQNSILEALDDLVFGVNHAIATWTVHPAYRMIDRWGTKDPQAFLDPTRWRVTAVVGTAHPSVTPAGSYVWTDIVPDVIAGDFDGDGGIRPPDLVLFDAFVAGNDGVAGLDADALADGRVALSDFGPNFSVFDTNYDGLVDAADRPILPVRPDLDSDGDADVADFGLFQTCFNGPNRPPARGNCGRADFDDDGDADVADFSIFQRCFNGPARPPGCTE